MSAIIVVSKRSGIVIAHATQCADFCFPSTLGDAVHSSTTLCAICGIPHVHAGMLGPLLAAFHGYLGQEDTLTNRLLQWNVQLATADKLMLMGLYNAQHAHETPYNDDLLVGLCTHPIILQQLDKAGKAIAKVLSTILHPLLGKPDKAVSKRASRRLLQVVQWLPVLAVAASEPSMVPLYFAVASSSEAPTPQKADAVRTPGCQILELASLFPSEHEGAGAATAHLADAMSSSMLPRIMETSSAPPSQEMLSEVSVPSRPMFGRSIRYKTAKGVVNTHLHPPLTPERPAPPEFQAVGGLTSTPFMPAAKPSAEGIAVSPATTSPNSFMAPPIAVDGHVNVSRALKFDETLPPAQVVPQATVPGVPQERRPWLPRIFTRPVAAAQPEQPSRETEVRPVQLPELAPRQPRETKMSDAPPVRRGRRWVNANFMGNWLKPFRSNSAPPTSKPQVNAATLGTGAPVTVTAPSSRATTSPPVSLGMITVDVFLRGGDAGSCETVRKAVSWSPKFISSGRSVLTWLLAQPVSEAVLFGAADAVSVSDLLNRCALDVRQDATADCCFVLSCADAYLLVNFRPGGWSMLAVQLGVPPTQELIQPLMPMLRSYGSRMLQSGKA